MFLDYLYSPFDKLDISDKTATALHHLGEYFEVARLRAKVQQFWEQNLKIDTCGIYYEHALIFRDETIRRAVVLKCCENIQMIQPNSHLFAVSDTQLWLDVLEELKKGGGVKVISSELSSLISLFCVQHKEELDAETFATLTDESVLPVISFGAALQLIKLEKALLPPSDANDTAADDSELSNLQERCVEALASSWELLADPGVEKPLASNPAVLSRVLTRAAAIAKEKLHESQTRAKQAECVLPTQVVITGAKKQSVNGVYFRSDTFCNGAPHYHEVRLFASQDFLFKNGYWKLAINHP